MFEVVDRGDDLGGHVVALGDHAQQHFEQFETAAPFAAGCCEVAAELPPCRGRGRASPSDHRLAQRETLEALGQ